jgi:hypothetical protein
MQEPSFYVAGITMLFTCHDATKFLGPEGLMHLEKFCCRSRAAGESIQVHYDRDGESGQHSLSLIFQRAQQRLFIVVNKEGEVAGHSLEELSSPRSRGAIKM